MARRTHERQHAEATGLNLIFGGREVTCGFTGIYFDGAAEVEGTALVGKNSVFFVAKLLLKSPLLADRFHHPFVIALDLGVASC